MSNDAHPVLMEPPVLSVVYQVLGPAASSLAKLDASEVLAQVERDTCYVCGRPFTVYDPDEEHHIKPKGHGGSTLLDIDPNKVRIDAECHRLITDGKLRFYRDPDDLRLWYEVVVDGAWKRMVPYGRLKSPEQLSHTLDVSCSFGQWLAEQRVTLETWDDESLRTQYHIAESQAALLFAEQCQIIHILAVRHEVEDGTVKTGLGLKKTAEFLGISYQTARLRHAVYNTIFAHVDTATVWEYLTPQFFYTAYRCKSLMNPIEALNAGATKAVESQGEEYTATQFAEDIKAGFREEGAKREPTCPYGCQQCKKATDLKLQIWDGKEMVASGPADDLWYCAKTRRLASELGPQDECKHMKARG